MPPAKRTRPAARTSVCFQSRNALAAKAMVVTRYASTGAPPVCIPENMPVTRYS